MVEDRIRDDRRDRLKQLRAFCQAARLGSITRAAERVYSSQPAVSLQIRALERDLGVTLFVRRGPHIGLTAAGRSLYRRALRLVEDLDRIPDTFEEQFRDLAGPLRIAAGETSASCLLPRYVEAFRRDHAAVGVTIRVGSGSECLSWLRGYEVDMVFAAMDIEPPDLEFRLLVTCAYELITPEGHPLARLHRAGPRDIGDHPQIAHTRRSFIRFYGEMYLRQHGVAANVVVDVDGWESIKNYVEAGLGIAIVPGLCINEHDRLCRIPYEGALPPRKYGIVTRRERIAPLAVQRFVEILDVPQDSIVERAGQASTRIADLPR